MTCAHDLRIRVMRPDEIALAADWAAAEGWNPGLVDAACFATVDPGGFFIGELDAAPAATISCVNYDERFAFLGYYIVRGDLRGRGYGLRIWNAAIAHARPRTIGLDGVVGQQQNYRKSGFRLAYANVRYGGTVAARPEPLPGIVPLADVPFATVAADDATVFPAPRDVPSVNRDAVALAHDHGLAPVFETARMYTGAIRPVRLERVFGVTTFELG
jgi:GNAT superfamily N-acetyltransferase